MEQAIFYIFVAIWAFAGYKKGAAGTGYIFTSAGIAVYFSVWLLPFSLLVLEFVPPEFSDYALAAVLLLSFIILYAAVRWGIEKFLDSYPVCDSDMKLSELPLVNNIAGGLFGAASGYVTGAFFAFLFTFIPIQLPIVSTAEFAGFADGKLLAFSKTVNGNSNKEWNEKQQSYVKELAGKYRKFAKTANAAPDADSEKTAQPQPETVSRTVSDTASPAAQKLASKAVNAVSANQENAMREAAVETAPAARNKSAVSEQPEVSRKSAASEGVTFSLMVPVLNEDGSATDFTKITKIGIRLPENGEVPKVIEAEVPHPVLHFRDRVIFRKMKIDMEKVTLARVRDLNSRIEVKYIIVDEK